MPVGIINGTVSIFLLLLVIEGAPPVFNHLYQVCHVSEQGHTQWTIQFAVEYPVEFAVAQVIPAGTGSVDNLVV